MKFEKALDQFKNTLLKEYGPIAENGLIKIGLHPEIYDEVVVESIKYMRFRPSYVANFTLMGVEIKPAVKDNF